MSWARMCDLVEFAGIWTEQVCCYCGDTTGSEDLICPNCLSEISGYEGECDVCDKS